MDRPLPKGREDSKIRSIEVKEGERHRDAGDDPAHRPLRFDPLEQPLVVDDLFFVFFLFFRFRLRLFHRFLYPPVFPSPRVQVVNVDSAGHHDG